MDLKEATEFLKRLATAATAVAGALEKVESELTAAKAVAEAKGEFWRLPGAKGSPVVALGTPVTDTEMMQWMRKNATPGCSWDKVVADYICYKEGSSLKPEPKGPSVSYKMPNLGPEIGDRLPQGLQLSPPRYKTAKDLKATDPLADLEAKEQDDLAKDAAEYDAILPQNDGRPAIDTSAMAMDISRKEVLHRRDQNITACDATKTERLPIEVFNDLLSTGATVGIPKASDQSRAGIRILFAGASGSGKSVAAAKLIGKNSENIPKIKTIFYGYTNAKGRVIQIIDTVGDPVFHTGTSSYYKEADHCILFSDKYLSQEDLSLFKPTTCFKRFKNQEDLKEYLDCL